MGKNGLFYAETIRVLSDGRKEIVRVAYYEITILCTTMNTGMVFDFHAL